MILLLLLLFFLHNSQGQSKLNMTSLENSFKHYYVKSYIRRFKGENKTHELTEGNVLDQKISLIEEAWKRYEENIKIGKIQQVERHGTTDDMVKMAAEEIWERTGGKLTDGIMSAIGGSVGTSVGGYVGGALGIACGIFIPPLQLPLVIGGVFIGTNLGRILGLVGGHISAQVVNSMIVDRLIAPIIGKKLKPFIDKWSKIANSSDATCRSDICWKGEAEVKCKCELCSHGRYYSDKNGLSACKICPIGSIGEMCRYPRSTYGNCGCKRCSKGTYGSKNGHCYLCYQGMNYTDVEGSSSCKQCSLGSVPKSCRYPRSSYGNCRCQKCSMGTYGTKDAHCIACHQGMNYTDVDGSTSCKQCPLGSVPKRCGYPRPFHWNCSCKKCSIGHYGTTKGRCQPCDGDMEYNDTEGATRCKICPAGTLPTHGHCGCRKV